MVNQIIIVIFVAISLLNKRMSIKIAYCLPSLFSVGGMEKVLTLKANYFADILGYDITIILTDGRGKEFAFPLSDKVKVINLDINYDKIWGYKLIFKSLIYSYKQAVYRHRLSKTLHTVKPDITVSMLRREINFISSIKDGSRKIGELHFNRVNYRDFSTHGKNRGYKGFLSKVWMDQLISKLKKVDKFVVLSFEDKERWSELNNVTVIYDPLSEFPDKVSDCSAKKVIAAGRFVNQKGFDLLIESWKIVHKKHPEWILEIYGSGDKKQYLKQISNYNLEKSCFIRDAVININEKYSESSIFAFSSRFEGFGMVITEAMSCGIPPVAFACNSGPREIITDGVNGLLVTPENIKELAQKLCYLIENEDIRKEMGLKARERARDFRIEKIAGEWDLLFKEVLTMNKNIKCQ